MKKFHPMTALNPENKEVFDISIWRRAFIKRCHTREEQRLHVVDEVYEAIEQMSRRYKWEDIYLFGSITKSEKFNESSDIDIAIQGLDKLLHYRFAADLSALLEREVDVVRLEDCFFAKTIKNRGVRWKKPK